MSRKQGPQFYNQKKLYSSNNLSGPGSRFFSRASRKEASSPNTLILALEALNRGPSCTHCAGISDSQNCDIIKGFCFKLLNSCLCETCYSSKKTNTILKNPFPFLSLGASPLLGFRSSCFFNSKPSQTIGHNSPRIPFVTNKS